MAKIHANESVVENLRVTAKRVVALNIRTTAAEWSFRPVLSLRPGPETPARAPRRWIDSWGPVGFTPQSLGRSHSETAGGILDLRYARRRGGTTRSRLDRGSEEALMLGKLIRGWLHLDPGLWEEPDRREGSTNGSEMVDRPSNGGGIIAASGDRLIPVLLLRFHP